MASKIAWFVSTPSMLLASLPFVGMCLLAARWRRSAIATLWLVALGLPTCGLSPLAVWIVRPLEERFPRATDRQDVDGIIVLGGGIDVELTLSRGQLAFNPAVGRILALADLAPRYPAARLVFSGGSDVLSSDSDGEADVLERLGQGVLPRGRPIEFERRSRNTHENAAFTARLVQPKAAQKWLLVTSAAHMPRAVGCFRQEGFDVQAYPVDFRTRAAAGDIVAFSSIPEGLRLLDYGMKEWAGLAAYRLAGYTPQYLPGP